ncbi:MAG: LAGLIDADG family homing endonuclease, partial [Patescibacteria group bacterium]
MTTADNQQERLRFIGWIVGFTDGEGCFSISVIKNKTTSLGYQVFPEFVITQGAKSLAVLESIRDFFQCGNIYINRR